MYLWHGGLRGDDLESGDGFWERKSKMSRFGSWLERFKEEKLLLRKEKVGRRWRGGEILLGPCGNGKCISGEHY